MAKKKAKDRAKTVDAPEPTGHHTEAADSGVASLMPSPLVGAIIANDVLDEKPKPKSK
jgi:hypothetical protein